MLKHRGSLPVDRGWAWFVVAAGLGINIAITSVSKCFALLLADFQHKFSCSAWELTSIQGTVICLWLGLAPISNRLSMRFTERKVVFAGAIVAACGLVGSSHAPSISWLFFTHGIITDIHHHVVPSCERRLDAMSLQPAWSYIALMACLYTMPVHCVMFLINETLGTGCGMIYAPTVVIIAFYFEKRLGLATSISQGGVGIASIALSPLMRCLVNEYGLQGSLLIQSAILLNVCVCAMLMRPLSYYSHTSLVLSVHSADNLDRNNDNNSERLSLVVLDSSRECDYEDDNESTKHDLTICSLGNITSSVSPNEDETINENNGVLLTPVGMNTTRLTKSIPTKTHCCTEFLKYVDVTLLCDPIYVIYLTGVICFSVTWDTVFIVIPSIAHDRLHGLTEISLLLSLLGGADFVGRLFMGWFSDMSLIPRRYIFSGCAIGVGSILLVIPLTNQYISLAACTALFGIVAGFIQPLTTVLFVDILGVDRVSSGYGLLYLTQSLVVILFSQTLGRLRDVTGSWNASFWFIGGLCIFGGLVTSLDRIIQKTKERRCESDPDETI